MELELEKYFVLINQTFSLAEFLSLNVFIGIDLPSGDSPRRCWSSNGKNLQFDFMSNDLTFSDNDVWLKSGRIIGQKVIEKNELFNLAMDGVTAIRATENSVKVPNSFPHAPTEVKLERFTVSPKPEAEIEAEPEHINPDVQPEVTHGSSEVPSQVTEDNACNGIEKSPSAFTTNALDGPNLLDSEIEMPNLLVAQELADVSLNDEPNTCSEDEDVTIDDISTPAPIQNKLREIEESREQEQNITTQKRSRRASSNHHISKLLKKKVGIENRKPVTNCRICAVTFASREDRIKHFVEKHCTCHCGASYTRRTDLKKHIATVHDKLKRFTCTKCAKQYYSSASLKGHMVRCQTHQRKAYPCRFCPAKGFASMKERKIHMEEKHLACQHCNKIFSMNNALQRHIRTVHEKVPRKKPYQCSECGKAFEYVAKRNLHVKSMHEKNKDIVCATCGKGFPGVGALNEHTRRHHVGLKEHACSLCPTKFFDACRLRVHMRAVHEGIKNVSCELCDAKFARPDGLAQHIKYKHSEPKFLCSFCPKKFAAKGKQRIHEKTHMVNRH